jgi:SAM-dependent methyltransferase
MRVWAVEPNAAMRAAAEPHPLVEWREGTAEATGLPDQSVDLVLCAQAFHWFRQRDALAEFHRVLKPGGRLALMWNARSRSDPLTLGYILAIHAVNGEHPAERRELDPDIVHRDGWFTPATLQTFENDQTLDREGLIGRATSASYVPREGAALATLTPRRERARAREVRGEAVSGGTAGEDGPLIPAIFRRREHKSDRFSAHRPRVVAA